MSSSTRPTTQFSGLSEDDDTFAPILQSFKSRAIWLGANLLTAFLASSVINLFEETIEKVVALAVLMPIVASMGGVAGSQTLTLVIRGIAQGAIQGSNSNSPRDRAGCDQWDLIVWRDVCLL